MTLVEAQRGSVSRDECRRHFQAAAAIWEKHLGPDNELVRLVRGKLAALDAD